MKRIEAIIRPQCLERVKDRLTEIGVAGLTVVEVKGFGRQKCQEVYRGVEFTVDFLPKVMVIIVTDDDSVSEIIDAITAGAQTGKTGDGRIFVTAIEAAVNIRSGAWNHAAV
jgi:nitrogen regulatory protein P-II 1